jgi:hypothetical protein
VERLALSRGLLPDSPTHQKGAGVAANDVKPACAAEAHAIESASHGRAAVVFDKVAPDRFFDQARPLTA